MCVRAFTLIVLFVAGSFALPASAPAAPLLFSYTPAEPLTGEVVTFTAQVSGTITWDLDGDDACDDASGTVATTSFPAAGAYTVKMCVNSDQLEEKGTLTVLNRPPLASFALVPAAPVAREAVTLTSTSVDPDGPISAQAWDLDGDGVFDDAVGETAAYFWLRAGTYPVALRVTDRDGAAAVAAASVVVAPRPLGTLTPAPVVRFVGRPTRNGAHLDLLTVTAPAGANIGVRCKGRNCPYKHKRFATRGKRHNLRALRRTFVAGTVIEIRITKSETVGKITRLRFRAGQRPARLDRCINPGRPNKLIGCPSG